MNVYPGARSLFLVGGLDLLSDPLALTLVGPAFTYDPTHGFVDNISGIVGSAEAVTGVAVDAGMATCDPVTFLAVPDGVALAGLVLFRDSGDVITSTLIAHIDRRADSVPLNPLVGDDGNLIFSFPDYLVKI